jgi:hypothetical protein
MPLIFFLHNVALGRISLAFTHTVEVQGGECYRHMYLSRVVIELFTPESSSLIEIHRRLRSMCVEGAADVRHWVRCFKSCTGDRPRSIRPAVLATSETVKESC